MSNGLGSPTCRSSLAQELTTAARRDCETSGFLAAPAPTGNYGIDIHIDSGVFGLSSSELLIAVQNLVVSPVWMALVWIAHSLIVMLEWGFSIDLLDGGSAGSLGSALAQAQSSLTTPWLPLALSVAAVLAAYHGLVRRKVADTLGELVLMGAMLAGGMWLMLDPTGTVGALGRWSNQAGLGTLAVAVQGSPASPARALGVSMGRVFQAAIEGPWCYLEFGDVGWCRDPQRLDPRLHAAGLRLATQEVDQAGVDTQAVVRSRRLLREAHTNGAVFLALPANGPARNSINDPGSLLRAICLSEQATSCRGAASAEAEFRTSSGTWSRVSGLVLIVAGLLGMALLLGYIALRLLMAAILSLFYLLLAPGVVLAPAFGEAGRSLFRAWLGRLLGAVVSKLVLAFLLGVVLAVMAVLSGMHAFGWWVQWLLMSAFWWGLFVKRHQLTTAAIGAPQDLRRRSVVHRVADALDTRRRLVQGVREIRGAEKPAPEAAKAQTRATTRTASAPGRLDRQALALMRGEQTGVSRRQTEGVDRAADDTAHHAQLERIEDAYASALANGEGRRASRLAVRGDRVRGEMQAHARNDDLPGTGEDRLRQHAAFLDAQALLPAQGRADHEGRRRDYATLSALVGYSRSQFEVLDAGQSRDERLEIDRELASRRERAAAEARIASAHGEPEGSETAAPIREDVSFERRLEGRQRHAPPPRRAPESDVMRDVRAVAEGRKRHLGFDRE